MKKIIYIGAIALLSFSCQKSDVVTESPREFQLSFISEKPAFDDDFRTTWNGSSVVWEDGNQMRAGFYDVTKNEWGKKSPSFKILAGEASTGIFKSESSVSLVAEDTYKFYTVFPSSAYPGNSDWTTAPDMQIVVPEIQALSSSSFDPKADIMVGRSIQDYKASTYQDKDGNTNPGMANSSPISIEWKRLVAFSEITFKNLTLASSAEVIQSVKMTAQNDAALTGPITADLTKGNYTTTEETSNEVECSGTPFTLTSGSFTVWFATLPFEANSLTFVVTTNAHTYTRSISGLNLDFKRNYRNTLGVSLASDKISVGDVATAGEEWIKTDISSISSEDQVVIVGKAGENYYAMSNDKGTSSAPLAVSVTVSDNKVTSTVTDNLKWNVAADASGITIYKNGVNNSWLYCTATNNGVRVGNNTAKVFTIDEDNGYLKHVGTSRYVGIYNNQDWRCYTSINANIAGQKFGFYVKSATNSSIPVFNSLAELVAAGAPTSQGSTVTVTLTNEEITSFYTTSSNGTEYRNGVFVMVGNQEVEIYSRNVPSDWKVGGTISGKLTECTWKIFNGIWELCPKDWSELTYTPSSTPSTDLEATLSIADISVTQDEEIVPVITTNVIGEYSITYVSDNENVVIADGDELVCGDETGTANIKATLVAEGYTSAEALFTVTVTSSTVTPDPNVPEVGTVLWSETWGTYTGSVVSYDYSGTTPNDGTISYTVSTNQDKIESATASGISSNNLFFYRSEPSRFTVSGVNLSGATNLTLAYSCSNTNMNVYYQADGVEKQIKSGSEKGSNSVNFTVPSCTSFLIIFEKAGSSANNRLDDISLVVAK